MHTVSGWISTIFSPAAAREKPCTGPLAWHGLTLATGVLAVVLLGLLGPWLPAPAQADEFDKLFGCIVMKRPINVFRFWMDVMARNQGSSIFVNGKKFRGSVNWDKFQAEAGGMSGMAQLRYVNTFWNQFPYTEDIVNWGQPDYWEIPAQFLHKSGDCEDYAIIKYYTLRALGHPAESMRIVIVKDTLRRVDHAILAVSEGGQIVILDNVSNAILSHTRLVQYAPQYSVNEEFAWVYLKGHKIR